MAKRSTERVLQHDIPEAELPTLHNERIDVAAEAEAMREAAPKGNWVTSRAETYKEGSVVERIGRDGQYEEWVVDNATGDTLYLRRGDSVTWLTRSEAAIEERAATNDIGESIAEHWDNALAATEGMGDKEESKAEKAFLDRYKKDIIRIASISASVDDMPDMARLLFDAVAEIRKQDAEGIDDMYNRAIKANDERLLREIHVDAIEEDEDIANRMVAAETMALTEGNEVVSVARGELSPFVALEITKGFDIGQMTLEDLDVHIARCDDVIEKLKVDKDTVAAPFGILELQEREQILLASRSLLISEGGETVRAMFTKLAESAAGKDRPSKVESSLHRALETGRIDADEARDHLHELSKSPDLAQHEKDGVARLLDELKLPESEEITEQTITPTPVTVEVEADEPAPKKASRAKVIRPDDGSYRVGNKILSADDRPAAETPKWKKPVLEKVKAVLPIPKIVMPALSKAGAKRLKKEQIVDDLQYRAPEIIEPQRRRDDLEYSPDRKVDLESTWFDEGEKTPIGAAAYESNKNLERKNALTETNSFRRLADNFGGAKEFVRQYNELKIEFPKLLKFSLEDVKNAGIVERWWYTRKMKQAAEASLKRLETERKTKLKRGKLQA